jgi:hypothetical protein
MRPFRVLSCDFVDSLPPFEALKLGAALLRSSVLAYAKVC